MVKFSIITPQYNSYDMMGRYFDSLEKQTYKDFEIVIVDDHSTDGSYEKIKEYSLKSPLNIKLFQTEENSGPGQARNIGLDNASGEWVTFVDNDDWVATDFLEQIVGVIDKERVNCIIYDYCTYREGETSIAKSMYINTPGVKSVSDCVTSVRNHAVGKVYKLAECKEVRFPKLRRCEDVAFVIQAIAACGGAYYLNKPLYYYLQRPTSLSNNSKLDETDLVKAFSILEDKLLQKYPAEMKEKSVADLLYGGVLMICKKGGGASEIKNYIKNYEKKYPQWWKCDIINHLGIFKKVFLNLVRFQFIPGLRLLSYIHSKMIK